MAARREKVVVAISGGVDSSTAAALLVEAGFDCQGVFMITNDRFESPQADALKVAQRLSIKLYVLDLRPDFEQILDYFCGEYKKGRTPNPCVFCNRHIKFGKLWDIARENEADLLATGHYARILKNNGSTGLYEAFDAAKDQSYALAMIDEDILPFLVLPLGGHSKDQTRRLAAGFGLGTGRKTESQEICFIPDDNYICLLEQRCPELARRGTIIDTAGRVIGEHDGIHRFTIGQRRGLRVAMGKPYYVAEIDAETNTITLGPKEKLMHRYLSASAVNWLTEEPPSVFKATVKIRYNDRGAPATVIPQEDNAVVVKFDEPNLAITPGQLAAFYVQEKAGTRVVGGGWIDKAYD
ncbi:MAG: tRNA 2-thiouridine(34) synthase MnmA [Planctomycetota bacterium]|jgi:tRNA-specific 2-thiouridylase